MGQVSDSLKVLDDFGEGPGADSGAFLRRTRRIALGNAPGSICASRASRERGTAMLAMVRFEYGHPAAVPTKDLRRRAQGFHETIELTARGEVATRSSKCHR